MKNRHGISVPHLSFSKRGDRTGAEEHLEAFLAAPGKAEQANIEHARRALKDLRTPAEPGSTADVPADPAGTGD